MEGSFDSISMITAVKDTWRICVNVVRLWITPGFNNSKNPFSLEMVLMDDQGSRIHATVRKSLVYNFNNLLREGNVYDIRNFGVGPNGGNFRTTGHHFRLNFQANTRVQPFALISITRSPFNLVPFADILVPHYDPSYLPDVIGLLTGVGSEREYLRDGKMSKMNIIELENEGMKIECALFDTYVDELNSFLASGNVQNCVVIIQFAKVKTFKGKIGLQNVMHATKLLFNSNVQDIADFRNRLPGNNELGPQLLSQLSDSPKYNLEDDFLNLTLKKTIEELKDCKEDCFCIVLATIKHIQDDDDWWYTACKCSKSVYPDSKLYFCERCNRHIFTVYPRYCIKVRVIDETDSATFVLFDQECFVLLKQTCFDILDKAANLFSVPDEVKNLVNKTLLFKVEVKSAVNSKFQLSYRVKRVTDDAALIQKFQQLHPTKLELDFSIPSITTDKDSAERGCASIGDASNVPPKNLFPDFSQSTDEKDVTMSDDVLHLTPVKRPHEVSLATDVDQSTTAKILKNIKKEKA